jgi:hypothetical protein
VDGSALSSGQYSNWNTGEPNNYNRQAEDCGMMYLGTCQKLAIIIQVLQEFIDISFTQEGRAMIFYARPKGRVRKFHSH